MRKCTQFIFFILFFMPVLAQRYPQGIGTFRTSGGFSFLPTISDNIVTYRATFTPTIGYFFSDEAVIGIGINYNASFGADFYDATLKFIPSAKYYYAVDKQVFIIGNFNYNFELSSDIEDGIKEIDDFSSVSFGPGVSYFFSRKIGIEATLLYSVYFFPDLVHQNKFSFTTGFNINIPSKKNKKKGADGEF